MTLAHKIIACIETRQSNNTSRPTSAVGRLADLWPLHALSPVARAGRSKMSITIHRTIIYM